jgi:acylphosphatase
MPANPVAAGGRRGEGGPERWQLTVRGTVQGVGYRAGCHRRACELDLSGWVRNRQDGSVELEAEGLPSRLEALERWCRRGPPAARVSGLSVRRLPLQGDSGFVVRR